MSIWYTRGMRLFVLGFICFVSAFFITPEIAFAKYIQVSPIVINKDLQARDIIREQVVLKNTSPAKLNVYTFVNNVTSGTEGGIEAFLDYQQSEKQKSLANWIEISRGVIELMPGEEKEIEFIIKVHHEATPGDYHALISFGTGTNRDEAEQRLTRESSVMVVGSVVKNTRELLQVKKFTAGNLFFSGTDAEFTYTLQNNGDEVIIPDGEILLYDRRGIEIGAMRVNGQGESILPGEEKEFVSTWSGEYSLGRHKAYLSAVYGAQKKNLTDTTYFFMLPWKQLLLLFTVLMFFTVYVMHVIHDKFFQKRKKQVQFNRVSRPVTPPVPGVGVINLKQYED